MKGFYIFEINLLIITQCNLQKKCLGNTLRTYITMHGLKKKTKIAEPFSLNYLSTN